MPIERGRRGARLLAHVLVSKHADHLRVCRKSAIYARHGVELDAGRLSGRSARLLIPPVEALERHVMGGATLHADDTPVPVLAPGAGCTRPGRLPTYVRDERAAGGKAPPAVLLRYAPDRKAERPAAISIWSSPPAQWRRSQGLAGRHYRPYRRSSRPTDRRAAPVELPQSYCRTLHRTLTTSGKRAHSANRLPNGERGHSAYCNCGRIGHSLNANEAASSEAR